MEQGETYSIEADGVKAEVTIGGKGMVKLYSLAVPPLSAPTLALVDEIKHELITEVKVSAAEMLDPKVMERLKEKFREKAEDLLRKKIPTIREATAHFLTGTLLHEMLGFGKLEFLIQDPALEEVVINTSGEAVRVYHKAYGWLETDVFVEAEEKILNYANLIARRVGRQISILSPLLDAHLVTGDRANAVLYPISNKGNTITIRKFARDPWTITDLLKNKTTNEAVASLIWLAIQYEMSVLISGGTASGKTSFLNVCMPFIPPNQRILSIEDTRELQLPEFLYWCPLLTRQPNPEGKGEVSMLDLLVNALRMRPDRIILGEMRKKAEAEVLFEAMHTGHSVYATVHADSMGETIQRLVNPPIEVPKNLLSGVNLNVVLLRDRKKGTRRTFQVGEFIVSEEGGSITVSPNILYRWKPANDAIVAHSPPARLFEEISRHTGMSQEDISRDLLMKQRILKYMVKNNIRSLHDVGKLLHRYYTDIDFVENIVKKDGPPDKLTKD
ncbi:CpaF family protein [Candidatus Woesearchaeota archaeon]|nr:CpaF family protein [Candidatus Woesearchaeota archaeon]